MAVLVEAISVIVRRQSIEAKVAGGFKAFSDFCKNENETICSDGELARIGFIEPEEAEAFVEKLGFMGLTHMRNGTAADIVVADQRSGFLHRCDWAEFALADLPGSPPPRVAACRLRGSRSGEVTVPDGWRWDRSISKDVGTAQKREVPLAVYAGRPGGTAPIAQLLGLRKVEK